MNSAASSLLTPRDQSNLRAFGAWVVAFAVTLIAATFLIEARIVHATAVAWFLPALAFAFGVMTVRAYVIFMRNADELMQKIALEGLAWGIGAAVIFMPVYRICERLGAPRIDSVDPLLVVLVAWCAGHLRGIKRYAGEEQQ